ncbi:SGNH/GDSL hydrolase family protein [Paenibacillus contaminans]|uniref:SGNH/GDSL hydrolase family protein n=1 Tax=Paenibacillus contaminans TaxID=450362 RepID=A0A329MAF8_9BACL|nr:SGNH/GDSL hydrolase family protein [Paenibacillus contaminans]RAV16658.1 SGNH/GDSL hydrolase family protein [Paenibacillus contaminans]
MKKLFVLGDSISMDYGPYLQQMLRNQFHYSRKGDDSGLLPTEREIENPYLINGGNSTKVLQYLQGRIGKQLLEIDVLLLNCGLHDLVTIDNVKQVHIENYKDNLTQMCELLSNSRLQVCWVRTTPVMETMANRTEKGFARYNMDISLYNQAADAIMASYGLPIADLHGFTLCLGDGAYRDGDHFTDKASELQAAFLAGVLQQFV